MEAIWPDVSLPEPVVPEDPCGKAQSAAAHILPNKILPRLILSWDGSQVASKPSQDTQNDGSCGPEAKRETDAKCMYTNCAVGGEGFVFEEGPSVC